MPVATGHVLHVHVARRAVDDAALLVASGVYHHAVVAVVDIETRELHAHATLDVHAVGVVARPDPIGARPGLRRGWGRDPEVAHVDVVAICAQLPFELLQNPVERTAAALTLRDNVKEGAVSRPQSAHRQPVRV